MNQYRARLFLIVALLMAGTVAIIIRLFTIQIMDNQRYATRSRDQTQQRRILSAKRGNIYDRKGTLLASSMESAITVNPDISSTGNSKPAAIGRVYPFGEIGGPLLGYVGKDGYGLGGVEFSFDKYLRGEDGWIICKRWTKRKYRKIGLPFKSLAVVMTFILP